MDTNAEMYSRLLDINEYAFVHDLFTIAYHALSGAAYAALALGDQDKLNEVEHRAAVQLHHLQVHLSSNASPESTEGTSPESTASEPLEIALYRSLQRIINPRQFSA